MAEVVGIEVSSEAGDLVVEIFIELPDEDILREIVVKAIPLETIVETTLMRDLQGQRVRIGHDLDETALSAAVVASAEKLLSEVTNRGAESWEVRSYSNLLLRDVLRYLDHAVRPSGENPQFNEVHVRNVLLGTEHWNRWVEQNWPIEINLSGAYLPGADLQGMRLLNANMVGADLSGANLTKAVLIGANLSGADLNFARLTSADMEVVTLTHADLGSADLTRAVLHLANLESAKFEHATVRETILNSASLVNADLTRADFTGARLERSVMTGAVLNRAVLNEADLRGAIDVRFDDNDIRGTRFTPRPSRVDWSGVDQLRTSIGVIARNPLAVAATDDPWSLLRRSYTGANLVLVWILFFLFVVPRVLTIVGLYLMQEYQDFLLLVTSSWPNDLLTADEATRLETLLELRNSGGNEIWQVTLGIHHGGVANYAWALLFVVLFVYNCVRFALTMRVVPLKDAESRSGVTPSKADYETLFAIHRCLQFIAVFAGIIGFYNILRFIHWFASAEAPI